MSLSLRTLAAAALLACAACRTSPTLESIRYGYSPSRIQSEAQAPGANEYNDMAAGWAPERMPASEPPPLYGRDGSPVVASPDGVVTKMNGPINSGIDVDGPGGGSRSLLLDLYTEAVEDREDLERINQDLQAALEMAEIRGNDLNEQLMSLQTQYDQIGREKTQIEQQSFDLAARLATAQIARLEAERALLEATLEWRRMNEQNNRPLEGAGETRR